MNREPSQYAEQVAELVLQTHAFRDNNKKWPLGGIALDEASFNLLVRALHDADLRVRREAAWVLGMMKSARTVEPLLEYARNPENLNRGGAVRALSNVGGAVVVQPLLEALRDPEADVRSAAMSGLARRGEASAVEPFLQAFQRVLSNEEEDAAMRFEIVMWIRLLSERLNDKATFAFMAEALEHLKHDDDKLMRREALRTLEWLEAP